METPDGGETWEDPLLDADLAELARLLERLPGFVARWPGLAYHPRMRAASRWSGWMLLLDGLPLRMSYAPPIPEQRAAYEALRARAGELAPLMEGLGFAVPAAVRDIRGE